MGKFIAWVVGLIVVVCMAASSCTRVGPGYVGIKVNMAGSNRGVSDYPATNGWVFYNPFSESVLEYPVFVQTAVWTKTVAEGNPVDESISFSNKDSMQVNADISISYQLKPDKVPYFYVKFRNDDLKSFTHGFLRNMTREKMDNAAGKYTIEQIMGDNTAFLKEARDSLQAALDPMGVEIQQFGFIGSPRVPQVVMDSINAKVQATQKALQIQNEVMQTEAQARKNVAEAEGAAKSQLIRAEAEARANRLVSESLTPNLVEWKRIDKWDGKLSQVTGGGGTLLNLGK